MPGIHTDPVRYRPLVHPERFNKEMSREEDRLLGLVLQRGRIPTESEFLRQQRKIEDKLGMNKNSPRLTKIPQGGTRRRQGRRQGRRRTLKRTRTSGETRRHR